MNKLYRLLLGVAMCFAVGCIEENFENNKNKYPDLKEGEVLFGAYAGFENGNFSTKTSYGKPNGTGADATHIILNWEPNDKLEVASPQAANKSQKAVYLISEGKYQTGDWDSGTTDKSEKSIANYLVREGEEGLQWGNLKEEHTFYAMYPASTQFNIEDRGDINLSKDGVVTGYLPLNQSVSSEAIKPDGNNGYIVDPDMRYAYMVAKTVIPADKVESASKNETGVTLSFVPIVTALQFDITAGTVGTPNTGLSSITVNSLRLYSANRTNISGDFTCDLATLSSTKRYPDCQDTNPASEDNSSITINFTSLTQPVSLSSSGKLNVTFFLLPTVNFEAGNTDLKLEINFTYNGLRMSKTATLGKEIEAHKKYFFKNLTLPEITAGNATADDWFSKLDDNVLVNQLSIPGAGNAASSASSDAYNKEQVKTLSQLWDLGVRCFELVVDDTDTSNGNLGTQQIVCGSSTISGVTFDSAIQDLTSKLKVITQEGDQTTTQIKNECLFIIASYQPLAKGLFGDSSRNPQYFMTALKNYLSSEGVFTESDDPIAAPYGYIYGIPISYYDPVNSTVQTLKGKICFLARVTQLGEDTNLTLTNVPEYLTYIQGWGSLKDKWANRYGTKYKMYDQEDREGAISVDRIVAGSSQESYPSYSWDNTDFVYDVQLGDNTITGGAFVQEWARVCPQGGFSIRYDTGITCSGHDINWRESYNEKLDQIKNTFLKSKKDLEASKNITFINHIGAYYIDSNVEPSYIPYVVYNPSNLLTGDNHYGGRGGNYSTYNAAANLEVYNFLTKENNDSGKPYNNYVKNPGPMGIVMMDYIGNDDASLALPGIIFDNNFNFELSTKGEKTKAKVVTKSQTSLPSSDIIMFE